jgi:hypothetical protein
VQFQVELAFEGVEDRLDGLPQGWEQRGAGPVGFPAAGAAQQGQAGVGQLGLEAAAVVVLVGDQDLTGGGACSAGSRCSRSSST